MNLNDLKGWVRKHIQVDKRIQTICLWYLLFLIRTVRKHSFQEASRFSEKNKSQFSRRKYLACNDRKAEARHILMGYRIRWAIEIFHKQVKMHLGFQDVASKSFLAVQAHVHWVYCAYILLHAPSTGFPGRRESLPEKQHKIKEIVANRDKARLLQILTQIGGPERCRIQLKRGIQLP